MTTSTDDADDRAAAAAAVQSFMGEPEPMVMPLGAAEEAHQAALRRRDHVQAIARGQVKSTRVPPGVANQILKQNDARQAWTDQE